MRKAIGLLCLAHVSQALASQAPLGLHTGKSPFDDDFRGFVRSTMDRLHVMGMSIGVVSGDDMFVEGFGLARAPDVAATPDTLFYPGSTTKAFTTLALQLLMDDGVNSSRPLAWQTRAADLIRDDFVLEDAYASSHVTLEDLASHRSGLPRHDGSYGTAGDTLRRVVRRMRHLPPTAEVRTTWQYCNIGYMALSHILETLTGGPMVDFLRRRIWEPLGMHHTYFSLSEARARDGAKLAEGYHYEAGTGEFVPVPPMDAAIIAGAGNIISTANDYARYVRALIRQAPPIPRGWRREITWPRIAAPNAPELEGLSTAPPVYSLGWDVRAHRGVEVVAHDGGLGGFGAQVAWLPALAWGFVALGNTDGGSNQAASVLFARLVDDLLDVPAEERVDLIARYEEADRRERRELAESRERLFPSGVPSPRVPHALPLSAYAGAYHNPGYQTYTFAIDKPVVDIPGFDRVEVAEVLHANVTDRPFDFGLYLEHVNTEHFVAWRVAPVDAAGATPEEAARAEFRVGADGTVARLGLELEPLMRGEKIWFDRVGGS